MIPFGEEKQTACGFEIECFATARECADHDSARRGERLLCCPQAFLAPGRADENEAAGVEPELGKAWRVRRAVLSKHAVFPSPDHASLPCPAGCETQAEPQSRCFRPGACRTQFMQRLAGHRDRHGGKAMLQGGWTRTHVLYMFYTPDSR